MLRISRCAHRPGDRIFHVLRSLNINRDHIRLWRMASTGLSIREACRRLNVSENTLRAMMADGRLPYRRIIGRSGTRGRIVIREADVDDLLAPFVDCPLGPFRIQFRE
jgi:excisionase family DNA binding protein